MKKDNIGQWVLGNIKIAGIENRKLKINLYMYLEKGRVSDCRIGD